MSCEIINRADVDPEGNISFNVQKLERGWSIFITGTAAPAEKRNFLAHCVLTDAIRNVGHGTEGTEETLTKMPCAQCGRCISATVINGGLRSSESTLPPEVG